jgi:hypothetical protein
MALNTNYYLLFDVQNPQALLDSKAGCEPKIFSPRDGQAPHRPHEFYIEIGAM